MTQLPSFARRLAQLALAVVCTVTAFSAKAQTTTPAPTVINVGQFSQNLATAAAINQGFFAEEGLDVRFFMVPSSTDQFRSLRDGVYDLVNTATDNCANYALNASNPLGGKMDVQIIAAVDRGAGQGLFARRGIFSVEELRGKNISVDAPDSGFAYVLYKILANHGMQRDVDYNVVIVGGSAARFNSVNAGTTDATLMTTGFDQRSIVAGLTQLDGAETVINPYQAAAFCGLESWMSDAQNKWKVVSFLRAYNKGLQWALDPANKAAAVRLLMNATTNADLAERIYNVYLRADGLNRSLELDLQGVRNILALRQEMGAFDEAQNLDRLIHPSSPIIDGWYVRKALNPNAGPKN